MSQMQLIFFKGFIEIIVGITVTYALVMIAYYTKMKNPYKFTGRVAVVIFVTTLFLNNIILSIYLLCFILSQSYYDDLQND
jgi:hypothetical protein